MKLISFTGPKFCGKSTAASEFMHQVEYPCKLSFAGPIKRALVAMGFTHDEIYNHPKEEPLPRFNDSPRHILQTLGTEWGRQMIHRDLWLLLFERQFMLQVKSGTQLVVIDDVRFDNEADMIKSLGGYVVQIEGRPGLTDLHASEAGISKNLITHTLHNHALLSDYLSEVRALAKELLK